MFLARVVLLLAFIAGTSAQAQAPGPTHTSDEEIHSVAVIQAKALLSAAANSDEATFLKFVGANVAVPRITPNQWRELYPALGKLRIHAIVSAEPTTTDLMVFDDKVERWAHLLIAVDRAGPNKITSFDWQLAKRPADVPPPTRLEPAQLVAATKAKIAAMMKEDDFSGAVLIAKGGMPFFEAAYGLANRATKTPATLSTQFRFGSMGKMFTAVSILQLAEARKLDLKEPIGRYLTDYPNAEIASKVTVENVLTHTGGTGDIFGPEFEAHRLTLKNAKDYVELYGPRGPDFPPGAKQAYSNYGFMLLGRIVEVVSGQSFDDYVSQHIFTPAHMAATGMKPEAVELPDRAVAYSRKDGVLTDAADTLPWRGTPAGGGYSTVGDMLKFANALMDHSLLKETGLRQLTTGVVMGPGGLVARYDFGAVTEEGRPFLGHSGGAPGMNGDLKIFPDAGYTVVLANRDPPAAQAISNFISEHLP